MVRQIVGVGYESHQAAWSDREGFYNQGYSPNLSLFPELPKSIRYQLPSNILNNNKICDYGAHCLKLAETIKSSSPEAMIICNKGRQGSFEVVVNDKLIYSKLRTMALPDYQEVADVIYDVSKGAEPREIKGQQPINCAIS